MNQNKDIATTFLKLASAGQIQEAYEKYVSPNFKHHNPWFAGDAESLKKGMEENQKQFPNKVYEIKHIVEDGDLVAVHGYVKISQNKEIAVVHILKFEENKIVEMWDIAEEIPKNSPNKNGMF
jgi:predicted SnoaL-like aldol condensation-catalyzing enzyme